MWSRYLPFTPLFILTKIGGFVVDYLFETFHKNVWPILIVWLDQIGLSLRRRSFFQSAKWKTNRKQKNEIENFFVLQTAVSGKRQCLKSIFHIDDLKYASDWTSREGVLGTEIENNLNCNYYLCLSCKIMYLTCPIGMSLSYTFYYGENINTMPHLWQVGQHDLIRVRVLKRIANQARFQQHFKPTVKV